MIVVCDIENINIYYPTTKFSLRYFCHPFPLLYFYVKILKMKLYSNWRCNQTMFYDYIK